MAEGFGHATERRSDKVLRDLLDGQNKILGMLNDQVTEHKRLRDRVDRLDEDVRGQDGEGGLQADVRKNTDRLNQATGAVALLGVVGAVLGWFGERVIKSFTVR